MTLRWPVRLAFVFIGGAAALLLAPHGDAQAPPPSDLGRDLYRRDCAYCHGLTGAGTNRGPAIVAPDRGAAAVDFVLSTGRMPVDDPNIKQMRRADPRYDATQVAAIADYIASLGPGIDIPLVRPQAGDLGRGADLYLLNCAACHGAVGIGFTLTSGLVAPSLQDSTPTQVAEAMLVGPGTMPRFVPPLSQHDVDSIARYVSYLQNADNRGGNALEYLGPIAEGFVGLTVGLGGAMLITRWIGTRD
jgi:quinol---cytochrome-c reductase cytochrome c subunit